MFEHFLKAQEPLHAAIAAELAAGRKQTHWMWFVFPQLRGLGRSPLAQFYGLEGPDEARAYLAHPVLGERLRECTGLVLGHAGRRSLHAIFGSPDDLKFRSSMTLFARAAEAEDGVAPFRQALELFCDGEEDPLTLALLARGGGRRATGS